MSKLSLNNVKIEFPKEIQNPNNSEIVEWLEFELGISAQMSMQNPLVSTEIKDCKVTFKKSYIDGVDVVF